MQESLHPAFGLIPLAASLAVVAYAFWSRRHSRGQEEGGVRRSDVAWACVFALLLLAMAQLTFCGLFGADPVTLVAYSLLTCAFAAVSLARGRVAGAVRGWLDHTKLPAWAKEVLVTLVVLLGATALGVLALERPYNADYLVIAPRYALMEGGIVALALLALCLLSQGRGVGPAIGVFVLCGIGIAQFYVKEFKNAAILPGDLFALGTAAAVSSGYSYVFSADVVWGIALAEAGICLLSLLQPPKRARRLRSVVANLAGAAVSLAALTGLVTIPHYQTIYGVTTNQLYWYSMDYYQRQGFLTSFVMVAQNMPIQEPEGYTEQGAQDIEASYAQTYDETKASADEETHEQFDSELPSVVVVMNETFSDLSIYQELANEIGYPGPSYFTTGLTDALSKGRLAVSVVGGGTCNTEFEFLTGTSLAYIGDGKYPYSIYDLSNSPSIVHQFKELGYETTAIHPNWPTNWNRNTNYPKLGFDRFLSYDGGTFDGDPWYHNGISDEATYDHVLQTLRSSDQPQFVFDVTMQNHGGYDKHNLPASDLTHYHASKLDYTQNGMLNEYLTCINESDRALEEFISELRQLDRPVILVFFGDHQPSIAPDIDDAYYPDETDTMAHAQRQRQTCYTIWANYDVAGRDQTSAEGFTSVDQLSALALEAVGGPLTDYEKTKLVVRDSITAMNTTGYLGADGIWYDLDAESPYTQTFRDLAQVTYLEFGSKVR